MLPRVRRIRTRREYQQMMRRARFVRGHFLTVRAMPGASDVTRCGFIVSTSVSTSAVIRNRIRRRLRAAAATIPPRPPADIVVIAHRAAVGQSAQTLTQEFLSLLNQLRHAPRHR